MTAPDTRLPDSWNDDGGGSRSRLWWIIGAIAVVLALVAGGIFLVQRLTKEDLAWQASSSGRAPGLGATNTPASQVAVTAKPGVYLWQDFDGHHLWVINGGAIAGAKGTITSNVDFGQVTLAIAGKGSAKVNGKEITFDLPAEPKLVGIDFNPGFYVKDITVDIQGPNGPIDPKLVTIGPKRTVTTIPFGYQKVDKGKAATS